MSVLVLSSGIFSSSCRTSLRHLRPARTKGDQVPRLNLLLLFISHIVLSPPNFNFSMLGTGLLSYMDNTAGLVVIPESPTPTLRLSTEPCGKA
ncbi:hypothetical protein SODALDRAFT_12447 [Sodiomyces alkalinus F11]|uniref:Uncharacterized protein n=1 Tax=Sodiomyces alkalinus (strain CBS 110278 / VKM F-3762 / F11) TaxID=1314773 RepID=A0A3N2Q6C3_SODAK|nr:hypothetical protein SODALDRAFT_12447 [Sodiomyces alkalinus F11]ROT42314.1 hypothetical protein SODALDRAFT_12447 [Sodiomyces alkalinus F11]